MAAATMKQGQRALVNLDGEETAYLDPLPPPRTLDPQRRLCEILGRKAVLLDSVEDLRECRQ